MPNPQTVGKPTFVVVGAAGDGKSSIVKKLTTVEVDKQPEVGRDAGGVTKCISEYPIKGPGDEDWCLVDTMGVGDHDQGVPQLIVGLKHVLQCGRQIDGLIVTSLMASNRLGTAAQILRQIILHGMVKNESGISPWQRVIVVGTQRDRCDDDEIAGFPNIATLLFKDTGHIMESTQAVTTSTKQEGGMSDLLNACAVLGRAATMWDPDWETNGGNRRMAVGVCEVIDGAVDLFQMKLDVELAWDEVLKQQTRGDLTSAGAAVVGEAGVMAGGRAVTDQVAASVGREFIQEYAANRAAQGVGSGIIRGSGIALAEGSEVAVGQTMMNAAKDGGVATLKSRAGNVVVNVGARSSLSTGVSAGARLGAGFAGLGAELIAGQFEGTKDHKKKIGFTAQVGTAATMGCAGGPAGAAIGAGVGALSWAAGQVLGHAVEKLIINSKGETNPAVLKYQALKAQNEAAVKKESSAKRMGLS